MRTTIPKTKPDLEKMFSDAVKKYRGQRVMMSVFSESGTRSGIEICAVVKDVRVAYGRINLLVEPVRGKGMAWVRTDRVRVVKQWDVDHEPEHASATSTISNAPCDPPAPSIKIKRTVR